MEKIDVLTDVLSANEYIAKENRKFFNSLQAIVINFMSSPGSGKTTIITETVKDLTDKRIIVIEGDVAGEIDAKRIEKTGVQVIQINTGGACHLEARMVNKAINKIKGSKYDFIFIENVGNLICPSSYNLGEDFKVIISSVSEGDDKPLKYPRMFQIADLLLLNKIDLLDVSDFNLQNFKSIVKKVNPELDIITLSAKTRDGFNNWILWLKKLVRT